ncbi:MAG: hypothetical protein ACLFNM_00715 [Candidatus Woesearchaeota archaeon]
MVIAKKSLGDWKSFLAYILGLLLLATTFFLRFQKAKTLLVGSFSYKHLTIMSSQESSSLIHKLFLLLFSSTPSFVSLLLFSFIIFTLTFILARSIIFSLTSSSLTRYISLLLLITTPGLLYFFVGFSLIQVVILLLLLLCKLFLVLKNHENKKTFSHKIKKVTTTLTASIIFVIILLSFTHTLTAFVALLLFSLDRWLAYKKIFVAWLLTCFALFFILGFLLYPSLFVFSYSSSLSINALFSFFGASFGFSLLILVFGIGGFIVYTKKISLLSKIVITLVLILSLWFILARCIALFILIFYAAQSLATLFSRSWSLVWLKEPFFILLFCILIFSSFSAIQDFSQQNPSSSQKDAFEDLSSYHNSLSQPFSFLKNTSDTSSPNVSSSENVSCKILIKNKELSPFVHYYTGIEPVYSLNIIDEQTNTTRDIFDVTAAQKIYSVLNKENVCYVYESIPEEITHETREGLSFVMKHSSQFTLINHQENFKIYAYRPYE